MSTLLVLSLQDPEPTTTTGVLNDHREESRGPDCFMCVYIHREVLYVLRLRHEWVLRVSTTETRAHDTVRRCKRRVRETVGRRIGFPVSLLDLL